MNFKKCSMHALSSNRTFLKRDLLGFQKPCRSYGKIENAHWQSTRLTLNMDKFDNFRRAWHQCLKKQEGMCGCRAPCRAAMLLAPSMILKYLFIPVVFYLLVNRIWRWLFRLRFAASGCFFALWFQRLFRVWFGCTLKRQNEEIWVLKLGLHIHWF